MNEIDMGALTQFASSRSRAKCSSADCELPASRASLDSPEKELRKALLTG